jgi:hypothetical protein
VPRTQGEARVDKKSPIVRVIRRPKDSGSDVLVQRSGLATTADNFFASGGCETDTQEDKRLETGSKIQWLSFCGVIGTGIVVKTLDHVEGLHVRVIAPDPEVWRRAGTVASKDDVCVVFKWQIVRDM